MTDNIYVLFPAQNDYPTLGKSIKVLLGCLSFLSLTTNKEKRVIHDLAAETILIKA